MNDPATAVKVPSQQMVEHLALLTLNKLGKNVVREARIRFLDSLGCGIYGARADWGGIIANVVYAEKSQGNATVLGQHESIAPARAALCNGTATHGFEMDDIAEGAHVHPGSVVVPAALAAAEQCGSSGERLLLGIIAGYEAMVRVGRAIGEPAWGFHITGVAGPIAAAVAAGVVMQLTHREIMCAVGIACSAAGGLKSFTQGNGGMVKRIHAGRAAESGVLACLLAQGGFTAPLAAVDGRFGLLEAFGPNKGNPALLVENLGKDYAVADIWTKAYPCCGALHAPAQALHALRDKHDIDPAAIMKIRIGTTQRSVTLMGELAPKETMAAQYSMPFAAGVALSGNAKDPRSFEGDALKDPTVCALAQCVELYSDPEVEALYPRYYATRVEVQLKNGTSLSARLMDAHGTPADPCSEDEIKEKFRCLAAVSHDSRGIESILALVERLDQLPTIEALSTALRANA